MAEVYLKIYKNPDATLVAVCDPGLVGRTFREGKVKLEVKRDFYVGALTHLDRAMGALAEADIGNLVGEVCVDEAVRRGFAHESAVIRISGVPHVQVVKL